MAELKADPAAGAPAKKMDEATATYLAALYIMGQRPYSTSARQELDFAGALRHETVTKDVVADKVIHSPSQAQRMVHVAQRAGLVEGDVYARLGIKED